jgi:hypothetical protein
MALASSVRVVADENLGAGGGRDLGGVVGAVVSDDNDLVELTRIRLAQSANNASTAPTAAIARSRITLAA